MTIKQLLRQILELPESASAVDGIERYWRALGLQFTVVFRPSS